MAGKHSSDEGFDMDSIPVKRIAIVVGAIVSIAVIICGIYFGIKYFREKDETQVAAEPPVVEAMPAEIEGYSVLGQLVIEKLGVEQYILDSTEDGAYENGVVKLYGDYINEIGNFCIAGHNYEGVFEKLNELEIDDTFYILNRKEEKTEYKIVGIYDIEPEDLTCLVPNDKTVEVTLITCENGAITRLVVKAEMIEDDTETDKTTTKEDV